MNQKTKILVIRKKEIIIGSIVAIAALIALIFFIITFFNKSEADNMQNTPKQNSTSQNTNQGIHNSLSGSSSTSLLDATMSGQPESASDNSSGQSATSANSSTNNQSANSTVTNSDSITYTYTPGVYTASMSLNGTPVDVQVTVDKHNINSIDLVQVSETVTTMYPMLTENFEQLSVAVMQSGSTKNIAYDAENKYTSTMLLNAIQAALDKCTVK